MQADRQFEYSNEALRQERANGLGGREKRESDFDRLLRKLEELSWVSYWQSGGGQK